MAHKDSLEWVSFISKYLINAYSMPYTVLCSEAIAIIKPTNIIELTFFLGEMEQCIN